MKLIWSEDAWQDYLFWQENNSETLSRINALIRDCKRDPFKGIGKPEPLKGILQGWWSRRITAEHRLVCRLAGTGAGKTIEIAQCRFHY